MPITDLPPANPLPRRRPLNRLQLALELRMSSTLSFN